MSDTVEHDEEKDDDPEVEVSLVMAAKLSKAAEELKAVLSIDEASFRILAPQAHSKARDYFVFEALDEVQKAVVEIFQTKELVGDETPDVDAALTRIVAESAGDGIALCQRKLMETLTDLIGFAATPDDAYFRDCLLHAQLAQQLAAQHDLLYFYGAESLNLAHQINGLATEIEALEVSDLDPSKAWHRWRPAPFELNKLAPGRVLASFSRRFDLALTLATDAERASLGFTYAQGFGRASANIHARPGGIEVGADIPSVNSDIKATIVIALSVLTRCQETLGSVPSGVNEWFRKLVANNESPGLIRQEQLHGNAVVGDIVMAYDRLAQVLEIAEGSTGYRSYRVRYLSRPPLPEISEDWHIAQHVKVVLDPERTRAMVKGQAETDPGRGTEKLLALSDPELMSAISKSIAAGEQAGANMSDAILAAAKGRRSASEIND